ncbi:MAG: hypothetical protein AB7S75_16130 [Desulfococcaceae bacterium]
MLHPRFHVQINGFDPLSFPGYAVKDGYIMVPEPGDRFRNLSQKEFAAFIRKELPANTDAGFGPVAALWK